MGALDDTLNMDAQRQQQEEAQAAQDAEEAQQAYALAGSDLNDPRYQDVLPGQPGTSESARGAMAAANKLRGEVDTGYASVQAAQQKQANAVRDALRAARQRLMNEKPQTSAVWFNIAKALGTPTQTGTFGEGVANASGAFSEGATALEKEKRAQEAELGKYDTTLAQYGDDPNAMSPELLNTQLGLLKLKLQQAGALDVAATRNGGRGAAVNTSMASKLAAEANDPNLSPEQRKAAKDYLAKLTRLPRDPNAAVPLTAADMNVMTHVAHYDESLQAALSRMSAEKRLAAQDYMYSVNPQWTEQAYGNVKQATADVGNKGPNGTGGRLAAFGGMLPHLELILNLSKALQGGNLRVINAAKAAIQNAVGGTAPINLQSAVQLWAPEIERAISLGQGSETEKQGFRTLIANSSKPDVVADQIGTVFMPMVASKVDNLLSGFYGQLPPDQQERYKGFPERHLSKEARRIIIRRGLLQDYTWDQGDLGDIGGTRGTIKHNAPGGPPKIVPTATTAAPAAAAPKAKALSPEAQQFLTQVGG